MRKYVIIGNGIAGTSAAEAIRSLDPEGSLTFIAREPHLPYSRPMISQVLAGTADFSQLPIRPAHFYEKLRAGVLSGQEAQGVDLDQRVVRTMTGLEVPYDRLLIASGADARRLRVEGADLQGIFTMRTVDDVRSMQAAVDGGGKALVLGGGLVGFKAAYGLMHRGLNVTMLIRSDYPLSMQVDAHAGSMIRYELERHGLVVRVGLDVTAFEGDRSRRVSRALLSSGESVDCRMVVAGKGVSPSLHYLDRTRISVDAGILVDDTLRTSVEGVYAAGDVAEHFDLARRRRWVNAVWPVAVEMGRTAGMNMAGRTVHYRGSLGRNVIRIFDLDVLSFGEVNPTPEKGVEIFARYDARLHCYRRLVFREDHLVGAVLVGRIEQGGVLMNAASARLPITRERERLLEPDFNFASLGVGVPAYL